jgi:Ca2+-binding EF-hand superfamily protein
VKDKYLYSPAELNSNLRTLSLFTKFDTNGSGALDAKELAKLYKTNGLNVSEKEIKMLYGSPNVRFTLEMFEKMVKDKRQLRQFRATIRQIR